MGELLGDTFEVGGLDPTGERDLVGPGPAGGLGEPGGLGPKLRGGGTTVGTLDG